MAFKVDDIDESQAPLMDHLVELRTRLIRAILALAVAFAVCLYFASDILGFLIRPLTEAFPPGQGKLIYTKLYEAFFVEMKVAAFTAFVTRSRRLPGRPGMAPMAACTWFQSQSRASVTTEVKSIEMHHEALAEATVSVPV